MKTYLFYFGSCFNMEFMGELLDEAVKLSKTDNNKVYFLACSGVNQLCGYNVGAIETVALATGDVDSIGETVFAQGIGEIPEGFGMTGLYII